MTEIIDIEETNRKLRNIMYRTINWHQIDENHWTQEAEKKNKNDYEEQKRKCICCGYIGPKKNMHLRIYKTKRMLKSGGVKKVKNKVYVCNRCHGQSKRKDRRA